MPPPYKYEGPREEGASLEISVTIEPEEGAEEVAELAPSGSASELPGKPQGRPSQEYLERLREARASGSPLAAEQRMSARPSEPELRSERRTSTLVEHTPERRVTTSPVAGDR